MKRHNTLEEFGAKWERAVERAAEEEESVQAPLRAELNMAAGLQVKAGIQSGDWGWKTAGSCGCTKSGYAC